MTKNIITLGVILIAFSYSAVAIHGQNREVRSAVVSPVKKTASSEDSKAQTGTNDSSEELSKPSLALKAKDFCASETKNKRHDTFISDLSRALDKKGSYDQIVKDIFNSDSICDNEDVFKMTGTWANLEKEVMEPQSFADGKKFYLENKEYFETAEKRYGVDPSPILGILRIETNFGQNFGEYPLVLHMYNRYFHVDKKSAISRLATWIPLAVEFGWDPFSGGSYAGAFGYPQFMPQNESLHYSADGDADGKINLFSKADAIHSVAKYLSEHGWGKKSNQRVVMRYNHSSEYAKIVLKYRESIKKELK